jgi:hypothetical protein
LLATVAYHRQNLERSLYEQWYEQQCEVVIVYTSNRM